MSVNQLLWVERFAPTTVNECILPDRIKTTLQSYVAAGNIPNLLLEGPPGTGKTSSIKALANELGFDFYVVNGSNEGRFLDTFRSGVTNFCTTSSMFSDRRKVVLIDEADNTTNDVQDALRGMIEQFQGHVSFVLTCNNKNKLSDAIQSRFTSISYRIADAERQVMGATVSGRLMAILDEVGVPYEKKVIYAIVKKYQPDWRRCIHQLQQYSQHGSIDVGMLDTIVEISTDELIVAMKAKKVMDVRKWVVQNLDNDPARIFRSLYTILFQVLVPSDVPEMIIQIADYSDKCTRSVDPEIPLMACLLVIMKNLGFK